MGSKFISGRSYRKEGGLGLVNSSLWDLWTHSNLSYFWNFGSLLGLCLGLQILTGVFLAMHYTPNIEYAFSSIDHIIRDVWYGPGVRYAHANGASFFFIFVYLHIGRGLYYGSYLGQRKWVWILGVAMFLVIMGTAFLGYTLVWGQMSFWGATVITNLLSAIPYVGEEIVNWVWGGFSVENPTLNRFFVFHFVLPFVLAGLTLAHLQALHVGGSNNPIGVGMYDGTRFHPYFVVKDLLGFFVGLGLLSLLVFYAPEILGHPDNSIPANPLVTPPHIVPEWYFLFAYAILRSIPNKLLGVVALFLSILVLLTLPWTHRSRVSSTAYRPFHKICFWIFVIVFLLLTWLGGNPVEEPYVTLSQIITGFYFGYFLTPLVKSYPGE